MPTPVGVYLDNSYVLAIDETPDSVTFRLEAVLASEHPLCTAALVRASSTATST